MRIRRESAENPQRIRRESAGDPQGIRSDVIEMHQRSYGSIFGDGPKEEEEEEEEVVEGEVVEGEGEEASSASRPF